MKGMTTEVGILHTTATGARTVNTAIGTAAAAEPEGSERAEREMGVVLADDG